MSVKAMKKCNSYSELSDLNTIRNPYERCAILRDIEAAKKAKKKIKGEGVSPGEPIYQLITADEFKNGFLLTTHLPNELKSFGLEMYRNLVVENKCESVTEKSLVMSIVMAYCRIEILHRKEIYNLNRETFSQLSINWGNYLSKELERANREYLTALQTLKNLKMPPLQFTLKTSVANIAQNQVVSDQERKNDKPI